MTIAGPQRWNYVGLKSAETSLQGFKYTMGQRRFEKLMDISDEPGVSEDSSVRYLHFNSPWIQGAMQLRHPNRLFLNYTEKMMAWLLFRPASSEETVTQLGLGAGSLTRFCFRYLPSPLKVVERNWGVIRICHQYFRVPVHDRLEIICDDAEDWVAEPENHQNSAVLMVDLYDADAQGPVCDSLSFYQNCAKVLDDDGILSVNLFGAHASYMYNLENLQKAFNGALILLPQTPEGNQVVLAFKQGEPTVPVETLLLRAQGIEKTLRLPATRWVRGLNTIEPL